MPDFTPQPVVAPKPVPPAGMHEDPNHPGQFIPDAPKPPAGMHQDPLHPGQFVKDAVPAGTHPDPIHPGNYIKDDPKAAKPKTLGEKKAVTQLRPGPEVVEEKPRTETVTVLEGELYDGLDELHRGIAVLQTHSAAGMPGSIIGEATAYLVAAEAKIKGLELK